MEMEARESNPHRLRQLATKDDILFIVCASCLSQTLHFISALLLCIPCIAFAETLINKNKNRYNATMQLMVSFH